MDEKKAKKLDKKIIWGHINYFRIKSFVPSLREKDNKNN